MSAKKKDQEMECVLVVLQGVGVCHEDVSLRYIPKPVGRAKRPATIRSKVHFTIECSLQKPPSRHTSLQPPSSPRFQRVAWKRPFRATSRSILLPIMNPFIALLVASVLLLNASSCAAGTTPRYFQTCRDEYFTMKTCAKGTAGKPDYFPGDQSSKVGHPKLSPLFTCLSGWDSVCCWNDGIMQKNNDCIPALTVRVTV